MAAASAIQNTLHLLLPTASSFPPALTDLAASLLAQSRVKASSLKPEEEIARTFACCHIACQRLQNKHGLEIGKIGPPCGPRIYKRLQGFLESALAAVPTTPRAKRVQDVEAKTTPTSARSVRKDDAAQAATPGSNAAPSSLGKRARTGARESFTLPRFTMPLIRHVCAQQGTPEAATHVYAGVESTYGAFLTAKEEGAREEGTPSKRRRSNNAGQQSATALPLAVPAETQIPALVAAVFLRAASVMYGDAEADADNRRNEVNDVILGYFDKQKAPAVTLVPENMDADLDTYLHTGQSEWAEMEWFQNLPHHDQDGEITSVNKALPHDGESRTPRKSSAKTPLRRKEKHAQRPMAGDDSEMLGAAGLLPGLGTMFQPAVDWLSNERRADLALWKREMLRSISLAEQKARA